jgi:hypothetical protein
MRTFMGITLPSIGLYYINRDNPRYQEIPQWQKILFWIIIPPGDDSQIIRIPKPFEPGLLFGSLPEAFLEWIDKRDPEAMTETLKAIFETAAPGYMPQAVLPLVENATNYSFFMDRPVVPRGKEKYPPELQYGTYTSETAKKLGSWVGYSPAKIDNILRAWSGTLGRYAIDGIDELLMGTGIVKTPPQPSTVMTDWPVVRAFLVRDPYGSSSESVDRLYQRLEKMEQHEKYVQEMVSRVEAGDQSAIKKSKDYKRAHPEAVIAYDFDTKQTYSKAARYLREQVRHFSDIRRYQREIHASYTMSPQEKRKRINKSNRIMTKIAQDALGKFAIGAKEDPSILPPDMIDHLDEKLRELIGGAVERVKSVAPPPPAPPQPIPPTPPPPAPVQPRQAPVTMPTPAPAPAAPSLQPSRSIETFRPAGPVGAGR